MSKPRPRARRHGKSARKRGPAKAPNPERILQMTWAFGVTHALSTALDLDLFTHVAHGKRTPDALALATQSTPRGVRMLVDALVALGLLERDTAGGPVSLADDVAAYLVKDRATYVGDVVRLHPKKIAPNWTGLTEAVKTGRPPIAVDRPSEGVPFWHDLVDALFPLGFRAATEIGKELARLYPRRALRVLDVAAVSGVWGVGAAFVNRNVRVTAMDLAETLPHAKAWVAKFGLERRFDYLAGDVRATDFGPGRYDAVLLGHICHSEGPVHTPPLLQKAAKALRPGGTIAIAEFLPDDDRNGPPHALLFALNMLVHTSDGDTFTFSQFRTWLEAAGFKDARLMPASAPSPMILATKA